MSWSLIHLIRQNIECKHWQTLILKNQLNQLNIATLKYCVYYQIFYGMFFFSSQIYLKVIFVLPEVFSNLQNGQTHSNNSSAICSQIVWPFCGVGA